MGNSSGEFYNRWKKIVENYRWIFRNFINRLIHFNNHQLKCTDTTGPSKVFEFRESVRSFTRSFGWIYKINSGLLVKNIVWEPRLSRCRSSVGRLLGDTLGSWQSLRIPSDMLSGKVVDEEKENDLTWCLFDQVFWTVKIMWYNNTRFRGFLLLRDTDDDQGFNFI